MTPEEKEIFKAIFNGLTDVQRNHLMSHFDKGDACFIEYSTGKFIGCHMAILEPYHEVLASSEYWCYGNLRGDSDVGKG